MTLLEMTHTEPTPRPLLASKQLTTGYGGRRPCALLRDVEVRLAPGELVAVLGPNGAGKSTLLRTLAGMQPALAGRVELLGTPLSELRPRQLARRVGVVLPERVAPGMLSAYDLIALGRTPHTGWTGRLRSRDETVIQRALQVVGIAHLADRDVTALSDGERQKVMIARALAQEPKVLILDEPTAFLDLPGRVEVMSLLKRLVRQSEAERSVLLSTHDLDLALRTVDRVWLLDRRGGFHTGSPAELLATRAFETAFESEELSRYLPRGSASDPGPRSEPVAPS
ncbi:MAG: ABC transporter ATP-binding protein [Acidobacteriota bacterium]